MFHFSCHDCFFLLVSHRLISLVHFCIGNRLTDDLAGVKVLHGLDKVIDGGAVVLTLKDQSILANGDINEGKQVLDATHLAMFVR